MALISEETIIALAKQQNTRLKKFNRHKTSSLSPILKIVGDYNDALIARKNTKAMQYGIRLEGAIKALPTLKQEKYREALDYIIGRIRGRTKKSDLAPGKEITEGSVTFHGNTIKVSGEGLTQAQLDEAISHLRLIDELVGEMAATNFGCQRKWFGTPRGVHDGLRNIRNYLRQRCMRITFIRLEVGARCDGRSVKKTLAGRVIPVAVLDGQEEQDFQKLGGEVHVASGMRIFLGPVYFKAKGVRDDILLTRTAYRFLTIFHEMTHKILNTCDHAYELDGVKQLVIDEPDKCIDNADTWGYFLADMALGTGRLPGKENIQKDIGSQLFVRRHLMGYDRDDED